MARTHKNASLNKDSEPDLEYQFYYFADLVAAGIVKNRTDLYRKIRDEGFPRPEKSSNVMQAAAPFRKTKVHAWCDRRAALTE